MNPYVNLAKKTIEHFVKTGQTLPLLKNLPKEMLTRKAGVFVSLHTKEGKLRGCVGTFLPTQKNLGSEIIRSAISAAQDPRFPSLREEELSELNYKVDVLSPPQAAQKKDLDPKKYGLIVSSSDEKRGLLLPDIPGIDSTEQQIAVCRQKGDIDPLEPVKYEIFKVERHKGKS